MFDTPYKGSDSLLTVFSVTFVCVIFSIFDSLTLVRMKNMDLLPCWFWFCNIWFWAISSNSNESSNVPPCFQQEHSDH
jgi:hypothetical protein